jgi:putative component of membrane protein insertase Oxa1/YidC/SpoIIIJ protein YidD
MAGADPTIISKGMRYRKLTINPLESISEMEYCPTCQDEVDIEVDEGKWKTIFVYRKRCLRCGSVIQWGVAKVHLQSTDPVINQEVAEWIQQSGTDRR